MIVKLNENDKTIYGKIMYYDIQNILESTYNNFLQHIENYVKENIPKKLVKNLLNNCINDIAITIIARIQKEYEGEKQKNELGKRYHEKPTSRT